MLSFANSYNSSECSCGAGAKPAAPECFRCSIATCDASFLRAQGIDIVVAGDSMMRQHFTRLVQLLRGRQRNVDYRVHTHGSYSYCDEVRGSAEHAARVPNLRQRRQMQATTWVLPSTAHDRLPLYELALSRCALRLAARSSVEIAC